MKTPSLTQRLQDHTHGLLLSAAIEILEESSVPELTVRAVAARARISERTVFRYFATRDEFLDAVAGTLATHMDLPPNPSTIEELLNFPATLYQRFEDKARLTTSALHSDLVHRMRNAQAQERWVAIGKLIDAHAPKCSEHERKLASANVRYFLSATSWHYYRFYFGFSLDDTIQCAERAVRQAVDYLGRPSQSRSSKQYELRHGLLSHKK